MEKITVQVGTVVGIGSSGRTQDDRQEVAFEGEELASITEYGFSPHSGQPTDTVGITYTLYKTAEGKLLVHAVDWSYWQGSTDCYQLFPVDEADLGPTGQYAKLGAKAGMGRPLTLDEYLG